MPRSDVRNDMMRLFPPTTKPGERRLLSIGLLALLACFSCSSGPEESAPSAPTKPTGAEPSPGPPAMSDDESHRKMIAELARIAEWSREESPYLGKKGVRDLETRLRSLPAGATVDDRFNLLMQLSSAYLMAGMAQKTVGSATDALAILKDIGQDTGTQAADVARLYLATAWLRIGETENCCLRNTPESCILPIRGKGVHTKQTGSGNAVKVLLELLEKAGSQPAKVEAAWLLNIAHMTLGTYPDGVPRAYRVPPRFFESPIAFPRFWNIAGDLGLNTDSLSGGAIVDDFNNDHRLDVIVSSWDPAFQLRYFERQPDGRFVDRAEEAGLTGILGALNMVQTDFDNDGNLDVYMMRGAWLEKQGMHPNSLLRNNGDGTFTDVTYRSGLGTVNYPTLSAAWADYDNDGFLDLFVGNERTPGVRAPCQLYRNNGDGTFTDVAAEAGVTNDGQTKGVTWGDYDADGWMDLYVSNYSNPNRLYRNNGDGTFTDSTASAGVSEPVASFPTWFWDYDNDGHLDLFVADYSGRLKFVGDYFLGSRNRYETGKLYRGDGKGGFVNVAHESGLRIPTLPMGANFGDLDGDGFLDFYLGTGDPNIWSLMPNLMFLNRSGERFADVTMTGGFGHLQKGHAIAFVDIDNDGDTDLFEQMGGAVYSDEYQDALYENPGFGNRWIRLKLVGHTSNRPGIGARIEVVVEESGRTRTIYRHVNSGGSFGANPLTQHIGLGKAESIVYLAVRWPGNGKIDRFDRVDPDRLYLVFEETGSLETAALPRL